MSCEHYKDALIDAAASGTAPQDELRAHLDACASCHSAFDEEQSLFAAIDSGLYTAANVEVPPSLLPRVRASLSEVALAHLRWSSRLFALTTAATAAVALFLAVRAHRNDVAGLSTRRVTNAPAVAKVIPTTQIPSVATPPERGRLPQKPLVSSARNAPPREFAGHRLSPETLVPRDQEALLASYAQQWGSRLRAPLVASEVVDAKLEPLKVQPIQITNLDVKPLAEEGSQ